MNTDVTTLKVPVEYVSVPAWTLIRLYLAHRQLTAYLSTEDAELAEQVLQALAEQAPASYHLARLSLDKAAAATLSGGHDEVECRRCGASMPSDSTLAICNDCQMWDR